MSDWGWGLRVCLPRKASTDLPTALRRLVLLRLEVIEWLLIEVQEQTLLGLRLVLLEVVLLLLDDCLLVQKVE